VRDGHPRTSPPDGAGRAAARDALAAEGCSVGDVGSWQATMTSAAARRVPDVKAFLNIIQLLEMTWSGRDALGVRQTNVSPECDAVKCTEPRRSPHAPRA
jgi:hypothetical protein